MGKERNILICNCLTIKKHLFVNLVVNTLIKVAHNCFQHCSVPFGTVLVDTTVMTSNKYTTIGY